MVHPLESGQFRRGRGGRPSRAQAEQRHRDLLKTARRLLLERGWDGASIDEISRQSGVAKRFIYARYPHKAALFVAAVKRYREQKLAALPLPEPSPVDIEAALVTFGQKLLDIALSPEALGILRLFVAEAERFRDHIDPLMGSGVSHPLATTLRLLEAYAARGAIELADPALAAEQFFTLIVGAPQRLALLGRREPPDREAQRLRASVRLFLDGCRPRAAP